MAQARTTIQGTGTGSSYLAANEAAWTELFEKLGCTNIRYGSSSSSGTNLYGDLFGAITVRVFCTTGSFASDAYLGFLINNTFTQFGTNARIHPTSQSGISSGVYTLELTLDGFYSDTDIIDIHHLASTNIRLTILSIDNDAGDNFVFYRQNAPGSESAIIKNQSGERFKDIVNFLPDPITSPQPVDKSSTETDCVYLLPQIIYCANLFDNNPALLNGKLFARYGTLSLTSTDTINIDGHRYISVIVPTNTNSIYRFYQVD